MSYRISSYCVFSLHEEPLGWMTGNTNHQCHESLENGEPLLQSRRLSCDASRKGLPWPSNQTPVATVATSERREQLHKIDRQSHRQTTQMAKQSSDKKIYISSVKKVQFSHMLPDQRDNCIHQSPIVYQHKGTESNLRSEVAPLWYHPFQTGH